jgi:acetyl esterase/lipase
MSISARTAHLAAGALAIALLAACSQQPATPSAPPSAPAAAEPGPCPAAPAPMPPAGAADGANAQRPAIQTATSIVPSDTSTSEVLTDLTGPQIQCGHAAVTSRDGIVYANPTLRDGTSRPLSLDLVAPADGKPHPLIVYVPGGGFVSAVRTNGLPLRTYLAEAGFTVASIEYRTQPEGATFVDGLADVRSAVRFLRAGHAEYGVDPGKVALWGESAGGFLVAMAGTTASDQRYDVGDHLDQSSAVQAVVDKFGSSDTAQIAADFDPAMRAMYANPQGPVAQYTASADPAAANPVALASAGDPPFLLQHGTADTIISPSQTLVLHNALRAAGVDSTRLVLTGAGHGDLAFLGDPQAGLPWSTTVVMDRTVDWLRKHLAS